MFLKKKKKLFDSLTILEEFVLEIKRDIVNVDKEREREIKFQCKISQ